MLATELEPKEAGAWLNSRGTKSGVVDLFEVRPGRYKTKRVEFPDFVSEFLFGLYRAAGVTRGAPDLVLWIPHARSLRFVEVKCPHWDRPTPEQIHFCRAARERGIPAIICEWEFAGDAGS